MKTMVLFIALVLAVVVAGCDCGGDTDSTNVADDDSVSGDDSVPDDDTGDDDNADDTDDDITDDDSTSDDDLDDDSTPDDDSGDNLARICWRPDLPPEEGFEWRLTTVGEVFNAGDQRLLFDDETLIAYWLEFPTTDHRDFYRTRLNDLHDGQWETELLNGPGASMTAMDAKRAPDGRIEIALTCCIPWSGESLCVCESDDNGLSNCRGLPWDDVRIGFISFDHTPDSRAGVLFLDGGLHPWYTEETSPGVWELGTIPGDSFSSTYDLTIGPDGTAHFTWPVFPFHRHYYGTVNETWNWDALPLGIVDGIGNIVLTPDNEFYMAASQWSSGDEVMGSYHRLGWSQWEFLPINEPWNNSGETNRLALDGQTWLNEAYTFFHGHTDSVLCWARRENGLWRKELVDEEPNNGSAITWIYGMDVSPGGVVAILYEWRTFVAEEGEEHKYLRVALRLPVEE